jgi:hypothetical protein
MKRLALSSSLLLVLAACGGSSGGGHSDAASSGLSYTNPTGTSGNFALVLDSASTPSNLVLDLVGPSGTPAVGVTFGFNVNFTQAAWATTPVANGTLFGTGGATLLCKGWATGGSLQGIAANLGLTNQVGDIGPAKGTLAKITLTPRLGAPTGYVTLTDSGLGTVLASDGTPMPIQIQVGSLVLQ